MYLALGLFPLFCGFEVLSVLSLRLLLNSRSGGIRRKHNKQKLNAESNAAHKYRVLDPLGHDSVPTCHLDGPLVTTYEEKQDEWARRYHIQETIQFPAMVAKQGGKTPTTVYK